MNNKYKTLTILFLLLVAPTHNVTAKQILVNISETETPFQWYEEVAFDEEQRMWFATTTGLFYKNGNQFTQFNTVLDGPESRFNDVIFDPTSKIIYTSSTNGISSINTKTLESNLVYFDKGDIQENLTKSIVANSKGDLFIGSDRVFNKFKIKEEKNEIIPVFNLFKDTRNWEDYEIFNLDYSPGNGAYLRTVHGLVFYNEITKKIELIYSTEKENSTISPLKKFGTIFYFIVAKDGKNYITTLDPSTNKIATLDKMSSILNNTIKNVFFLETDENQKTLWITDDRKVYHVDLEKDVLQKIYALKGEGQIEGIAAHNGVIYVLNSQSSMATISINPKIKTLDISNSDFSQFTSITEKNGQNYIGTNRGVLSIEREGTSILKGTEQYSISSVAVKTKSNTLVFSSGVTVYEYDLNEGKVISSTFNPKLNSNATDAYWRQNSDTNYINQLTVSDIDEVYYETFNEGLWKIIDNTHELHESENTYNHVAHNLNIRSTNDSIYIVRQAVSIIILDEKGKYIGTITTPGQEIKGRHYKQAIDPTSKQATTNVINERYHQSAIVTNNEMWIGFGNGTFTKLDKRVNHSKHYDTGVPNANCIQHYQNNEYFVVNNTAIYQWNKVTNINIRLADLTGKISNNIALTSKFCKYTNGTFVFGSSNRLIFATLDDLKDKTHTNRVLPSISYILDKQLNIIKTVSHTYDAGYQFLVNEPTARFINILIDHDNPYTNPSINVIGMSNGNASQSSVILPIKPGTNSYDWSSNFGDNVINHPPIKITADYSLALMLHSYKNIILSSILLIVFFSLVYNLYIRKYNVIKARLSHVKIIADQTVNNIDNVRIATINTTDGVIENNGHLKRPLSKIKESINLIGPSLNLLKALSLFNVNGNTHNKTTNEKFILRDLAKAIFDSPKLQYAIAIKIECPDKLAVSASIEPLIYFLQQACVSDQKIEIYISQKDNLIKIDIKHSSLGELKLLSKAILEPNYNKTKIQRHSTLLFIERDKSKSISTKTIELRTDNFHDSISDSKSNILLLGHIDEFDTESKTSFLIDHLLGKIQNPKFKIVTHPKELIEQTLTYPISYCVYIGLYSQDFSYLKITTPTSINKDIKFLTITNRSWFDLAYENGATLVIEKSTKPENVVFLLESANAISDIPKAPGNENLEKLHKLIDKFITEQRKKGSSMAEKFPRTFDSFCKEMKVYFSKAEITNIERTIEERIIKYCTRYRVRKFAERLNSNPNLMIEGEKRIFGFAEKSRGFELFKEEFGMTASEYRLKVNKHI